MRAAMHIPALWVRRYAILVITLLTTYSGKISDKIHGIPLLQVPCHFVRVWMVYNGFLKQKCPRT